METSVEIGCFKVTVTGDGLSVSGPSDSAVESFSEAFPKLEYLFRAGQMLSHDRMLQTREKFAFTDGAL